MAVAKKRTRIRREPEEARAWILDAAAKVFATRSPDAVGLKEVAEEAEISHSLITHYFGTYQGLVEATLERRFNQVREELLPALVTLLSSDADVPTLLAAHRKAITRAAGDPSSMRLAAWALLNGRVAADDFFPHRMQGLRLIADAVTARSKDVLREDLEFLLVASFALSVTLAFGTRAFAGALGKTPSPELDAWFERQVDEMFVAFLDRRRRRGDPSP